MPFVSQLKKKKKTFLILQFLMWGESLPDFKSTEAVCYKNALNQHFPNYNVYTNHLRILLRCIFSFWRSDVEV